MTSSQPGDRRLSPRANGPSRAFKEQEKRPSHHHHLQARGAWGVLAPAATSFRFVPFLFRVGTPAISSLAYCGPNAAGPAPTLLLGHAACRERARSARGGGVLSRGRLGLHGAGPAGLQDGLRRRRLSGRGPQHGGTRDTGGGCADRGVGERWDCRGEVPTLGGLCPLTRAPQCLWVGLSILASIVIAVF